MKDMLSVKEFSRLSGIENTTLRYWDEIGLFSPAKRDPGNNYRYYTLQQIITVNFIKVLSRLSIPLKTISNIEGVRDPHNIMDLIEQQERMLDLEMDRLRESYSIIHTRLDMIRRGLKADPSVISVLEREERALIMGPPNQFEEGEDFIRPFMRFCQAAKDLRINLSYPIGGLHTCMESFIRNPGQPEHFFSADPTGNIKRAAGKYMVGFERNYYGEFGDLPARMAAFAEENALNCRGPVHALYLLDEVCIRDPSQYLVQVVVGVQ